MDRQIGQGKDGSGTHGGLTRRGLIARGGVFALAVPFGASALAGCGSGGSSSTGGSGGGSDFKVLQNYDETANVFWNAWAQGGKDAMADLGLEYNEEVSEYDIAKQRSIFENAQTQGYEGVSMKCVDEGSSATLVSLLTDSGITVVNCWTNAPWSTPSDVSEDYLAYMAANDYVGAKNIAEVLMKKMGGKGNLVHLQGVKGQSSDTERTKGLEDVLKEFPEVKLIAQQPADYLRTKAQSVMENILNGGTEVNAVYCQNDDMAMGALQALKSQSGTPPLVTGMDGTPEMLEAISAGSALGTWSTLPRYGAGLAIVRIFDALSGVKSSLPERMMGWGTLVIDTPASATEYKKIVFAKKSPWDWRKASRALNPKTWDAQNPVVPLEPDVYWARRTADKPSGYTLPEGYDNKKEFEGVREEWLSHYTEDPLKSVLDLTTSKKPILGA
jgi:ribose transport system substrate-binding protein